MVDFALTDEQKALQKLAHDFAQSEIRPYIRNADQSPDPNQSFPWEIIKKGLQLSFGCIHIPEEYGGLGKGLLDSVLVTEELAWGDAGIAATIGTTSDMGRVLSLACSEAQKGKWLREMCKDKSGTFLLAGSFTEPTGGSEILCALPDPAMGVRTTAVRDGNEYVLNGSKCFITNAGVAKLYLTLARTDKTKPNAEGCSLFLIPGDASGLRIGRAENKMGLRSALNGGVFFNDVHVPVENMLGEEGEAFKVVAETFRGGAVTVGAAAVGLARAAYETALKYSNEREIWGQPIRQYELIADKLAEMRMKIEASRALVWKTCWAIEHPEASQGLYKLAAMAKVFPSRVVQEVTTDAMQILGAYGYSKDYEVEKYVRDAMAFPIRDTTNEVLKMSLAKEL
jgi:alkylation response protein AidB-like acyl-CoA dehydrogenase